MQERFEQPTLQYHNCRAVYNCRCHCHCAPVWQSDGSIESININMSRSIYRIIHTTENARQLATLQTSIPLGLCNEKKNVSLFSTTSALDSIKKGSGTQGWFRLQGQKLPCISTVEGAFCLATMCRIRIRAKGSQQAKGKVAARPEENCWSRTVYRYWYLRYGPLILGS